MTYTTSKKKIKVRLFLTNNWRSKSRIRTSRTPYLRKGGILKLLRKGSSNQRKLDKVDPKRMLSKYNRNPSLWSNLSHSPCSSLSHSPCSSLSHSLWNSLSHSFCSSLNPSPRSLK